MELSSLFGQAPPCTLVNLTTGEEMPCLANPTELVERVAVNWNRQAVLGLSHQVLQYQSTGNRQLPSLEFYLDKLFARETTTDAEIAPFRAFLLALTVPSASALEGALTAPPRVLVVWPSVLVLEAVVCDVEFRFQRFGLDGAPLLYTATCTFEEILDARMTSEARRAG